MLRITIPGGQMYDEETRQVSFSDAVTVDLEHSLVSLSKWESVWEKPFLGDGEKTTLETLDYVQAMCLTPDVPPEAFSRLTNAHLLEINNYISAKMTATWFTEIPGRPRNREIITSEIIYYWLITHNIPFECQTWHLNRLFALVKVCNEKNAPKKKMSPSEVARKNRQLNEQRRAQHGTRG